MDETKNQLVDPMIFWKKEEFQPVDTWEPAEKDKIFKTARGSISFDVSSYFGFTNPNSELDTFVMTEKRSYNNPNTREHTTHYLNYFEKFYDRNHELLIIYSRIKYLIDIAPEYNRDAFFNDMYHYIMNGPIFYKIFFMNRDNYSLNLNYRIQNNPNLQYNDKHGMIMMEISVTMNIMIPLMCHFMYVRRVENSTEFILALYDILLDTFNKRYDVDIDSKLYETAISNILRSEKRNQVIWDMQDIRGINTTIHAIQSKHNILINIMPKYRYDGNLVHLNFKSILRNTEYQITDIEYEYDYSNLSSSKRDEDLNSEFDKYESFLSRTDESLLVQNQCACDDAMNQIRIKFGPFSQEEIQFYKHRLSDGAKCTINSFQRDMVFNLFLKYFGDSNTLNSINLDDYVTLIIAAKRILESTGMVMLPYIISAKVVRLASRKNVNKKELTKIESSPLWEEIRNKYKSSKIETYILSIIACILTSEFQIIDPTGELDGQTIEVIPELVCEEVLLYINLI